MKLKSLYLKDFKNLRDLAVDFDAQSASTVLVGRNGTGKSNILEAITIIFRDLDLGEVSAFSYRLSYACRGREIAVDCDPDRKTYRVKVHVDGRAIGYKKFAFESERKYLPKFVFGYYSGPGNRLEEHFLPHQELFYKALLQGEERPLRPLLYARPVHSQFVLLAFFLEEDREALEFLRENLFIEDLDAILFVMRQPPWKSDTGDARFWGAAGTVEPLLAGLYEHALAPMRFPQRVSLAFRKFTTRGHLYLYLGKIDAIRKLRGTYRNQQELFKALESTYISDLLGEVRIRVRARNASGTLTFRELAEGEQQLLLVLGLLRFTREDESLFLLDEPDTHLNPAWSVRYMDFLKRIGGAQENSHVIMTTHDPLVVAGLERGQVQLLRRDGETGAVSASMPDEDPKGMGVAALLTSDVYGLRSQLDTETMEQLDRKRQLAAKETLTDAERVELAQLERELEGLPSESYVRDPLYPLFVEAMSRLEREEGLQVPVLGPNQFERRRDLALTVLEKLRHEGPTD